MPHLAMQHALRDTQHALRDRCGSTSSAESTGSSQPLSMSLDSQAEDPRRLRQSNSSRYKTELCRAFEEYGTCKYGEKCQFAHGMAELRSLCRHPKYKTELCRTFHTEGFCPYGKRCHFVHTPKEELANLGQEGMKLSPMVHPLEHTLNLGMEAMNHGMENLNHPMEAMGHPMEALHHQQQQEQTLYTPPPYYEQLKNEYMYYQTEFPPLQCVDSRDFANKASYHANKASYHANLDREIGELKRQFVQQQQQQQYGRHINESWQAQALRQALTEVAKQRLPVFSGLGTA